MSTPLHFSARSGQSWNENGFLARPATRAWDLPGWSCGPGGPVFPDPAATAGRILEPPALRWPRSWPPSPWLASCLLASAARSMTPLMFLWHSSSGTALQTAKAGGTRKWGDPLDSGRQLDLAQGGRPTGPARGSGKAQTLTKHPPGQLPLHQGRGKAGLGGGTSSSNAYTPRPCSQPQDNSSEVLSLGQSGALQPRPEWKEALPSDDSFTMLRPSSSMLRWHKEKRSPEKLAVCAQGGGSSQVFKGTRRRISMT